MIINNYSQKVNFWRFFADIFMVTVGFVIAFMLRFDSGMIALPKGYAPISTYLALLPALVTIYSLVFMSTGVYARTLLRRRIWIEHFDILRTHSFAFLGFITITYFFFEHRYSRITLLIFFVIAPLLIAFGRSFVRKINRAILRNSFPKKKALVVGTGSTANELVNSIKIRKEWDLELVSQVPANESFRVAKQLAQDNIAVIFVATSAVESQYLQEIYDNIGNTMTEIVVVPDFGVPTFLTPKVVYLDSLPAVALNTSPLNDLGRLQKRIFDVVFSFVFIVVFSPLFLFCAILVRFSSSGPILYKQERMGLDGSIFNCLKFRGMRVDAEVASGPVWATAHDSRVTSVGKFLRKTSLDEIPQFFNVLKGDMSIVGPRPERPHFVNEFRHQIPGYMLRHKAKAGITGWAQINGWRGNTSLQKRIECDLWYLQNWSLWTDLKICMLTPIKGLINKNAY